MRSADQISGLTLLEVLVVLTVLGILLALSIGNYLRWRATSATSQGAQEFAAVVSKARMNAKRANNECWQVSLKAYTATNTQYQIKSFKYDPSSATPCTTTLIAAPPPYTMPPGTQLVRVTGSGGTVLTTASTISFTPPYGTTDAAPDNFQARWTADTSISRDIRVTGVFGKVIVK